MAALKRRSAEGKGTGEGGVIIDLRPPSLRTRDMLNGWKRHLKREHRGVATALGSMLIDIPIAADAMLGLAEYVTDAVIVGPAEKPEPLLWYCLYRGIMTYEEDALVRVDRFGAYLDVLAGTAAEALQSWRFGDACGRSWHAGDGEPLGRWLVATSGPYELQPAGDGVADTKEAIRNFIKPDCWRDHHGGEPEPVLDGVEHMVVSAR